ncbi:unnamed protein product [Caenorhabditis auriculariae]|uniref:Acyltransferase 3 domain-containing protein n=1 Tax=Caenorhabditis auriculariae TaxID=2777116 RepID=A0A8S1H7I3_9PELO|nr:unnamed protein product [Caenorhabditis auriculariae]
MNTWSVLDQVHEIRPMSQIVDKLVTTSSCSASMFSTSSLPMAVSAVLGCVTAVLAGTLFPKSVFAPLSIRKSLKELTAERHSKLDVVDVFRFVAILWVMLNHTGSEGRVDILDRLPSADAFKKAVHDHPIFGALLGNSALGVEIFLVLSGLLAARSWLRLADQPFWPHFSRFIFRRLLRLAPSMFAFVFIATGPIMQYLLPRYTSSMISACGTSGILSHLTFTSNFQATPTCMGYLWYLGLDMQLFIAAPFFLHLLHKVPRRGFATIFVTVLVSAVLRSGYCISYETCNKSDVDIPFISYPGQDQASLSSIYAGLWNMYSRPWTKCGPYLVGLLLGYLTMVWKGYTVSEATSKRLFWSCAVLAVATIYGILPEYWNPDAGTTAYNVLYTSLFRTVFALAIAGMIFSHQFSQKNTTIPGFFGILAKLTYNAYLLHMPIVYIFNWLPFLQTATSALHLLILLPAVATLSFSAAAVFYVFVESPFCSLVTPFFVRLGFL